MNTLSKTFENFDKFGLEPFAEQLTKYLLVEAQFVEGSFVLSLNSEFGSGKTTFFEMWKEKLKTEENPPNVVLLNAWQSDFQGDALLAIISGLLESLGTSVDKKEKESIKETAGKLCRFALSIGNDVVNKFIGINVIKAGEYAESGEKKSETTLGHACFEVYRKRQEIFNELKSQLTNLTKETENPIIIIIDELDRCRPTYAIEFLETIKHFFDIEGLIFVLGVDIVQLESSAEALFGQKLVFSEYYRKFAHRNVSLPVKSKEITEKFCRKLVDEYFTVDAFKNRDRFSLIEHDRYQTENIEEMCCSFSLNARQIHEIFRIAAHAFSTMSEGQQKKKFGWYVGTIFMIILHLKDSVFYHRIGKKEISLEEFTNHLKTYKFILSNSIPDLWWSNLLYIGAFGTNSPKQLEEEFAKLGVDISSDRNNMTFNDNLVNFSLEAYNMMFRESDSAFMQIYKILEGLKSFER
ncbi:MAG: hypothetical protein JW715_08715 [Sedimentisphaerales bacterium]|nr:hypothetical protein [Sedimentisphaerales bacterium]